jgi:hypothetical protein
VACNSWLLLVGRSGAGQQSMRPGWGMLFDAVEQHPSGRIACPKHVEQITSSIKHWHLVGFFLPCYDDARTNTHQIHTSNGEVHLWCYVNAMDQHGYKVGFALQI